MILDYLVAVMKKNEVNDAMIWQDRSYSYAWLLAATKSWQDRLIAEKINKNTVVALVGDFSPNAVALLLALIEHEAIIIPLSIAVKHKQNEFCEIAQAEIIITLDKQDSAIFQRTGISVAHDDLKKIIVEKHPGLILFSSGSTGKNKAALHDFLPLLEKFTTPRQAKRMLTFLLFDHIGGINTLLFTLYNGGCVITVNDRNPKIVCEAIQKYKVEILPTSPTFINLLMLSEAYQNADLSSLELVTYGTEVMPQSTLQRFHELFPTIRLQQTYGLSELGILRSKSKSSDSLFVKIGGEGFETRVRDGLLEIKAKSAMLGYLNAPSPFTDDGWFKTGDAVEVEGEYFKILGRTSEIINVGGEKVYPAEIESILQQMDGVESVAILGEKNSITGTLIKAKIKLKREEPLADFRQRMQVFCKGKLSPFKIPQKIVLTQDELHSERFKKIRKEMEAIV
jgi:long-chain acyl-CoA synthetase